MNGQMYLRKSDVKFVQAYTLSVVAGKPLGNEVTSDLLLVLPTWISRDRRYGTILVRERFQQPISTYPGSGWWTYDLFWHILTRRLTWRLAAADVALAGANIS